MNRSKEEPLFKKKFSLEEELNLESKGDLNLN